MTTRAGTPPDTLTEITVAARGLVAAADRLGPGITDHGPGCPAAVDGSCTCGTLDFANAMDALRAALLTLT